MVGLLDARLLLGLLDARLLGLFDARLLLGLLGARLLLGLLGARLMRGLLLLFDARLLLSVIRYCREVLCREVLIELLCEPRLLLRACSRFFCGEVLRGEVLCGVLHEVLLGEIPWRACSRFLEVDCVK